MMNEMANLQPQTQTTTLPTVRIGFEFGFEVGFEIGFKIDNFKQAVSNPPPLTNSLDFVYSCITILPYSGK